MTEPFLGEIRMFTFSWPPQGWLLCNGAQLPITQNAALYALIGYQFGGDKKTVFNIPDLRGRTPVGTGRSPEDPTINYVQGNQVGAEAVTLQATNVPSHSHQVTAYPSNGTQTFPGAPAEGFFSNVIPSKATTTQVFQVYQPGGATIANPQTLGGSTTPAISTYGGGQPHNNMQPFAVTNFCIAAVGDFPMRD